MMLLTVKDASAQLGIGRSTLRLYSNLGKIRSIRTSQGDRLFTPRDVAKFAKWKTRHVSTPATGTAVARAIAREEALGSE